MKVFRGVTAKGLRTPAALTIGNFDGVHRGHRAIIGRLDKHNGTKTLVTFEPHPQQVLHGAAPLLLVSPERKLELLDEAGIEQVVVIPFNKRFSQTEPEDFVEKTLLRALGASAVVVGANFRFGRFARGDTTMLRNLAKAQRFEFEAVRIAELERRRVSSTEIRHAIQGGDLGWANRALGRPHEVPGRVVRGAGRGKDLGFPTANLKPRAGVCLPGEGVYAGRVRVKSQTHPAAISVGTNPTFGPNPLSVEAFVMDFRGALYGRSVTFEFVAKIRDQQTFASPQKLSLAM